ncbi:MAG TPA: hypothetical protein VGK61_02185 [Planctomycetota bacterium]
MKSLRLSVLALSLAGCAVTYRPPDSYAPKSVTPAPEPAGGPGAPPVPPGQPIFVSSKTMNYDAALGVAFDEAQEVIAPQILSMRITGSNKGKDSAWATSEGGTIFARVQLARRHHRTYVTFFYRVYGGRANQQLVNSFPENSHKSLGDKLKEVGKE